MPKNRAALGDPTDVHMSAATYSAMCDVMDELAFRGPDEEALVLRIAKAGGVDKVVKAITRRRTYGKKMAAAKAGKPVADATPKPPKRGARRKKAAASEPGPGPLPPDREHQEPEQQELV